MTYSASDLSSQALRKLGVLAQGQTASGAQGADALETLNQLVDGWRIDGKVSILAYTRNEYALTANTQRYTIGAGGNFNQTRPEWIEWARVIPDDTLADDEQTELPCELFTLQRWAAIVVKALTSTYPIGLYYDHAFDNATERGNIDVWPIPDNSDAALVLYAPSPLAQFADLDTDYDFAPMYPQALVYNLALHLAPEYGREVPDSLLRFAQESKALIEVNNLSIPEARIDAALRQAGGYDARSGSTY